MNADELRYMLKNAVKGFLAPDTIRPSEDKESSALRQQAAIREMFDQLKRFVSTEEFHEECLKHAQYFISKEQYRPALHSCLHCYWDSQYFVDRSEEAQQKKIAQGGKMAEMAATLNSTDIPMELQLQRLAHRIRGTVYNSVCKFFLLISADCRTESKDTLEYGISELEEIVKAMQLAFPHSDKLYYLIYNATIYLYQCCLTLINLEYYRQAAVFLGWCCRSCDATLPLATTRYLDWRVRLYTTLALCYEAAEEYSGALTIAQYLQQKAEELYELEKLDVVPPSEQQMEAMKNAIEAAKVLVLKYTWCSGASTAEVGMEKEGGAKEKDAKKGKDKHHEKDASGVPLNGAEFVEKIKSLFAHQSGKESLQKTIIALLSILSDGISRSFKGPTSKKGSAGRVAISTSATEGLLVLLTSFLDEFIRKNELGSGYSWSIGEAPVEDGGKPSSKPPAKQAAKGKVATLSKEDETKEEPLNLVDIISFRDLSLVCRAFFVHGQKQAFEKSSVCLVHMLEDTSAPKSIELRQEIQLLTSLLGLHQVVQTAGDKTELKMKCMDVTRDLMSLLSDAEFTVGRLDLLEDAALQLYAAWGMLENCHELVDADLVFEAVVRTLIVSKHRDVLLILNVALAAAKRYDARDRIQDALLLLKTVEPLAAERQTAFVFNHDNTTIRSDTTAEVLTMLNAATTHDGIWLRTLVDQRTEIHRLLAYFRMKHAIKGKHQQILAEHEEKKVLLHEREAKSNLFGELTQKERRAISNVDNRVVEPPATVQEMELKLIAWGKQKGNAATAIVFTEIAKCQKSTVETRKKMESALSFLEEAAQDFLQLKKKMSVNVDDVIEPTSSTGFSIYYAWSLFVSCCQQVKTVDLILHGESKLFPRFITSGEQNQKVWNRNVCAWDSLRKDVIDRCSPCMLKALIAALLAISNHFASEVPNIHASGFVDNEEDGLDPKRFSCGVRQHNRLRCSNILMHAAELSVAVFDESLLMLSLQSLCNALNPLLLAKTKSSMMLHPLTVALNCFKAFQARRWQDGALQLTAARLLRAAFETAIGLPECSQKTVITSFTQLFCDVWIHVFHHPNAQQQRHMKVAAREMEDIKGIILQQKEQPHVDAAQEQPAKGKTAKAPKKTAEVSDAPRHSVFVRSLNIVDQMPQEFLELLDFLLFQVPLSLPTIESTTDANPAAFPASFVAIATALQNSVSAANAKLAELKGDLFYPKLAVFVCAELLRKRHVDNAIALCQEAIKEIKNRHATLSLMESEAVKQVMEHITAERMVAQQQGQLTNRLSPRARSTVVIGRRLMIFRRRYAFRKLRVQARQYDMPHQAQLALQLSSAYFFLFNEEEKNQEMKEKGEEKGPVAPAKQDSKKTAAPKGGKGTAKAQDEKLTPRENDDDVIQTLRMDTLLAAMKSLTLFGRCGKWTYFYSALQHYMNMTRVMLGSSVPSTLVDILAAPKAVEPAIGRGPSSVTPLAVQQVQGTKMKTELIMKFERQMKLVCYQILSFLAELENGNANPARELDFLHATGVKTGVDCAQEGGLLHRTTSLEMWLSDEGKEVYNAIQNAERDFEMRLQKIFQRERAEAEESEQWARHEVERQWITQAYEMATEELGFREFVEDEDFETPLPTNRDVAKANQRKLKFDISKKKAELIETPRSDQAISYSQRLGPLSLQEFIRCFMYCVQCLQYGHRKPLAIQLCLQLNKATSNEFAVTVLPFAMNLQNATSVSMEQSMMMYNAAYREQLRTQKLMDTARQAWRNYKETELFKRVQTKLAAVYRPSQRCQPTALSSKDETGSVVSYSTAATGGNSSYKEVVNAYNTAVTYLRQKHSTQFLVTLLCELGQIHMLHRNRTEAERIWNDCVDASVGQVTALARWRQIVSEASELPAKLGLWKLLAAVSSLANLAMYCYNEKQTDATNCCMFAAELLWQFNSLSLSMPQRHWDEAFYTVKEIVVDVPLSCENNVVADLPHKLLYVAHHLLHYGFYVQCITVSNCLEYFATHTARCLPLAVQSRALKARAAAHIGNYGVAFNLLFILTKGKSLPDPSFGHLNYLYDIVDKVERQPTAQTKGGGGRDKGKGKDDTVKKPTDENEVIEFDQSKSLTDEMNLRVVETLGSLLSSSSSLLDAVQNEYGAPLSRQVLLAIVDVLLALGGTDPFFSWVMTDPTAQTEAPAKGGKVEKGKAAEAKQVDNNVCAAAQSMAEKIIANMYRSRPKSVAEVQNTKDKRAQTPQSTSVSSAVPVEDGYIRQYGRLFSARLYRARGMWQKASAVLEEMLSHHDPSTTLPASLRDVPSFTYVVDGRFLCTAYIQLAEMYFYQRRWKAAVKSCTEGLEIAEHIADKFSMVELKTLQGITLVRDGDIQASSKVLQGLIDESCDLEWSGTEKTYGQALTAKYLHTIDVRVAPLFNDLSILNQYYVPEKGEIKARNDELKLAVEILSARARTMGLNLQLDSTWACAYQRYNKAIPELHATLNIVAAAQIRRKELEAAVETLRATLVVSQQGLEDRYPHLTVKSKMLLAICLRHFQHSTASPIALHSDTLTEMPDLSADALDSERADLLMSAMHATITTGIHDYEVLRQLFCELFFLYAFGGKQSHHFIAFNCLRLACQVTKMQSLVFHQPCALNEVVLANLEEFLPCAVVDELEDLARRDNNSQMQFTGQFAGMKLQGKPPLTLSLLLTYFSNTQLELRTVLSSQMRETEVKLTKVRSYLQSKPQDQPVIFDKMPSLFTTNTLKSFSLMTQAYPSTTTDRPTLLVEGVPKPSLPHITILVAMAPYEYEDTAKDETTATKPAKGKAAAQDEAPKPVLAINVPVLFCIDADQAKMRHLHHLVRELCTKIELSHEVNTLDDHVEGAGGKEGKDKKAGGGKDPKKGEKEAQPEKATTFALPQDEGITEMKGEILLGFIEMIVAAKHNGTIPQQALAHEKEMKPLYPSFALEYPHLVFLGELLECSGGATVQGNKDLCTWFSTIREYLFGK